MSDAVLIAQVGRVKLITLNRPDKKNALTLAMYNQLTEALIEADNDSTVRVILLQGAGGCFSAGNDIADFVAAATNPEAMQAPLNFLQAITCVTKPIVAAVDGVAVGIGSTLLLHCDLVMASDQSRFQLPFVKLGLVPEGGSSLLLPQLAGHRKAFELLVLGEAFDASTAQQIGLINRVVDSDQLSDLALQQAEMLAGLAPESVRQSKAMLKQVNQEALQQVIMSEGELFAARLHSAEAQEALRAFMEKRPADFSRY